MKTKPRAKIIWKQSPAFGVTGFDGGKKKVNVKAAGIQDLSLNETVNCVHTMCGTNCVVGFVTWGSCSESICTVNVEQRQSLTHQRQL